MSAVLLLLAAQSTVGAERPAHNTPDVTVSDSVLENPRAHWRISRLPPEVRRRIHLTASRVPAFPHEDPRLMDPRKWPKTMVIGGEKLPLTIWYTDSDYWQSARSMDEVKTGSVYTLRYGRGRGPVYSWVGNGALAERSWRRGGNLPPEHHLYLYYPSGELLRFEYQSNVYGRQTDPTRPAHSIEEVFARNGALIGFGHVTRRGGKGKESFIGYWLGEAIDHRKFHDLTFQAQRSVNERFWKPRRQ